MHAATSAATSAATAVSGVVTGTMVKASAAVSGTVDLASGAMRTVRSKSVSAAGAMRDWLPPLPKVEFMSKDIILVGKGGAGTEGHEDNKSPEELRQQRAAEMMSYRLQHQDQDRWGYVLPDELLLLVFCHLGPQDVMRAGAVCKHWHFLSRNEQLWRELFQRDWEHSPDNPIAPVPKWKAQRSWRQRYLDNLRLRRNWRDGNFVMWQISAVDPSCIGVALYGRTVWCLQVHIEQGIIATGCDDGTIRIWDLGFATCIHSLAEHEGVVYCLKLNGHILCSGSEDETICIWDYHQGVLLHKLPNLGTEIRSLDIVGDKLVAGGDDAIVRVWQLDSWARIHNMEGHSAAIKGVCGWGSAKAVSASEDKNLRVWDLETGESIHTLRGHREAVRCVHVPNHTTNVAVSGSADTTINVWDLVQGTLLRTLVGHRYGVHAIQCHGNKVVSGSEDRTIKVWDIDEVECRHNLIGHTDEVLCLQFDSERIVSASVDESIRIWDFTVHKEGDTPAEEEGPYSFWS
eukprot:TRINITY_DN11099_c0_g1_i2.p1 TRINITY_DN11099_c0_g1~~TRINITY_DN11099_c0_g1_i2.p1  ORF type:complete len:516 (-),score=52.64 TRINITY_DN11099_c0_g1_i2:6-1553(-)